MANLKLASVNEVKIEKGVALPMPMAARRKPAWPLRLMEVGDSFALDRSREVALRSAIYYEQKHSERQFAVRSLPTEMRCWRTA